MIRSKILTGLFFLTTVGFYGEAFGYQPKLTGLFFVFAMGSVFGMLNSVLQICLVFYLLYSAIAKPYYIQEKNLFLITSVVLGLNCLLNFSSLPLASHSKLTVLIIVITNTLFIISLVVYGRKAMSKNSIYS